MPLTSSNVKLCWTSDDSSTSSHPVLRTRVASQLVDFIGHDDLSCWLGVGPCVHARRAAIGLPKIVSPGDGNPVLMGVAHKFSCTSSWFWMVFVMIGLMCLTLLLMKPLLRA